MTGVMGGRSLRTIAREQDTVVQIERGWNNR